MELMSESYARLLTLISLLRLSKPNSQVSQLMFWSDTLSLESYEKEIPQSRVLHAEWHNRPDSVASSLDGIYRQMV